MKIPSFRLAGLLVISLALCGIQSSLAQLGNDNPTGTSGQFNGNVTTGGSYDPYTGNATRSVTDLVVAGGVSSYPLAFGRVNNSRYTPGVDNFQFGAAGNWRHTYQWSIDPITIYKLGGWTAMPTSYYVNYPDGRRIFFNTASPYFKATVGGIGDRFQQPSQPTAYTDNCYLLLPDGGKVWFQVQIDRVENTTTHYITSTFSFSFVGIIDPEGRQTLVSYPADGSMTMTEPAGRTLKLFYGYAPSGAVVIDHVTASDGRSVKYNYGTYTTPNGTGYACLANISYFNDPQIVALYNYQDGNIDPNGRPLLRWAIDCMYEGPMWSIGYIYVPGASGGVYGQLQSENYLSPWNATIGAAVSTLGITGNSRTETRGDGPARTFNYVSAKKQSWTDFKNVTASKTFDANAFVSSVTDRKGNTTNYQAEAMTGKVTLVTQPLTPFDGGVRPTVQTVYGSASCPDPNNRDGNNPYYPYSIKDERNYTTTFWRDASKRVTQINYPNVAYETFTYNGFGQVLTHRMTSGGMETFAYYDQSVSGGVLNGLLKEYRDPYHSSGLANLRYSYYTTGPSLGRVQIITDALNNTTEFLYNTRGQVTRVNHMGGSYVEITYDNHGDQISVKDELGHTTNYAYDDYKRVVNVIDPRSKTTSYSYGRNWDDPLLHTTSNRKAVFSPMGKTVHTNYDENWQLNLMREPTPEVDAWTSYGYDAAGNLTSVQDPRGNVRTYGYDQRNRRTSTTDPAPFSNQVTSLEYDGAGNVTKETRPDGVYRSTAYDALNRVVDTYGFSGEHTHYQRDYAGNVTEVIDARNATYDFSFDLINRKLSATYPLDFSGIRRTEGWLYDGAGNMYQYTNQAGQVKTLLYDNRNRPYNSSWSANVGPTVATVYDNANRVSSISTSNAGAGNNTTVAFGYDEANRQTWEEQTLFGYPLRHIDTPRDDDGNRSSLGVTGFYAVSYDYTGRGQLKTIYDGANPRNPWFAYTYDAAGNMTKRQDPMWGLNDSANVAYDQLNRVTMWENTSGGDNVFARNWYRYDSLGRELATQRDEQQGPNGAQGDTFSYDNIGQLTMARYNADYVWTSSGSNWTRQVSYNLDALSRTGNNAVNENGTLTSYTPNNLNQYTNVGGGMGYDSNFNLTSYSAWGGWTYAFNAENQLTSASGSGNTAQFVYDGLGRCVKRTINGATGLFAYDGWKPIVEWDGSGNFSAWNIYGAGPDEILWRCQGNGNIRYHTDKQGNIAFLLDGNGNGIERYTYDAFGSPTVTDWNGANPRTSSNYSNRFMFTGREFFAEMGVMDYRNRFYHPGLGRFLQPDPTGFAAGDLNLFRYCGGDPVNNVDPTGEYYRLSGGGNNYTVNIPIYWTGPGNTQAARDAFTNGIQSLSGNYGGINVTFQVTNAHWYQTANTVNIHEGFGKNGFGWESGGNRGDWFAGGGTAFGIVWTPEFGAAHSVFHFLYFKDGYDQKTGALLPGVDAVDILGGRLGSAPTSAEISKIIQNGNAQGLGNLVSHLGEWSPGFSQHYLLGISQFGPGWGTGSGLNPGSFGGASAGAVQSTLFQTLFGVPGGGGQPGEGSHPVSFELN